MLSIDLIYPAADCTGHYPPLSQLNIPTPSTVPMQTLSRQPPLKNKSVYSFLPALLYRINSGVKQVPVLVCCLLQYQSSVPAPAFFEM